MKPIRNILILLFVSTSLFAADYYCDPVNGKPNNDGSLSKPWRTLQEVVASNHQFEGGDNIYLLNGNHGEVRLNGIYTQYLSIQAYENHSPSIQSLIIGADSPTMRLRFSNINFGDVLSANQPIISISEQSKLIQILYCDIHSIENSKAWTKQDWKEHARTGMQIGGERHRILFNRFYNLKSGIINTSKQTNFQSNSIHYFTENGIQTNGDNCVFENNLIKNSVNLSEGSTAAMIFPPKKSVAADALSIIKLNTVRGNIIYNYTNYQRKLLGSLMGIVSFDNVLDMCTFENNLVVCDHWHGITLFNINNSKVLNNTVVDPYLGTIYEDETREDYAKPLGPVRLWLENKIPELAGNVVANNLVSASIYKDVEGVIENNPVVGSTYAELDETFHDWEYLDFRLKAQSPFVNAGVETYFPSVDAVGAPRKAELMINPGAYEYTKDAVGERDIVLQAERTDIELQSNGVKNWDGQPYMRVGGAGDVFNSNAIIPFSLPAKKSNERITRAQFSFHLDAIHNSPVGSVDVFGLLPRAGNEISFSDYYEGEFSKAKMARVIQEGIMDGNTAKGKVRTSNSANAILIDYINSLYEAGYKAGDQFFIRLNHNRANVAKYNRWIVASANAENVENRPQIMLRITPQITANDNQSQDIPFVYIYPSPSKLGSYTINILNNKTNAPLSFSIKNMSGEVSYEYLFDGKEDSLMMTGQYALQSGYYLMTYKFGDNPEQIINFNIW